MSTLLNIYNENFGYQVATNGTYVAVGNPNSKLYNCSESFARIGEVAVYHRNQFDTNYSFVRNYRPSTPPSHTLLQSRYGDSVSLCDKYMGIGDWDRKIYNSTGPTYYDWSAAVDVYRMYDNSNSSACADTDDTDFILPTDPFCTIDGNPADWFGKSVGISDNYLAISAPSASSGRGAVYVYKYNTLSDDYDLQTTLTSGDAGQKFFGSAVAIDKTSENRIAVGTLSTTHSRVYIYQRDGSTDNWGLVQTLSQNTASNWLKLESVPDVEFYPLAQSASRYGYSVALSNQGLVVGAPNDLVYLEYSGSSTVRQRGAFYFYYHSTGSTEYILNKKLYGDATTFKDNMLGYSVDMTNQYVLVGSPKPYFPFSSIYLSSSVDTFDTNFENNDFGASTFNGQALLYKWIPNACSGSSILTLATTAPIAYRKRVGECFSAFGASVAVSNENLVIGSPAPLNDDMYLATAMLAEQSGSGDLDCSFSVPENIVEFKMEDAICDCSGDDINGGTGGIIYVLDQPAMYDVCGKSFIYNFADLQKDAVIGNVFYNNNRIIVNNTGSILSDFLKDPINPLIDYIYGTYQSQVGLNEKQYICTVEPGEFNVSTNPTAVTGSLFDYGIINQATFDFSNLDIILRYINYRLTAPRKESWWDVLVEGDVQQSMFSYFASSMNDYTADRLTPELRCAMSTKNFDANNDGVVDYADAFLIWNYYIQNLQIENYKQYVSPTAKRKNYDDIIKFLDARTGKGFGNKIKSEFFSYHYSASVDPTGSYLAPYITQVGLYAGADLVAIGKIANPIKNNGQIPINIVVKWDT
jgi:hypothetical protein